MASQSGAPGRCRRVMHTVADESARSDASRRIATWLNPILGSFSSPPKSRAFLDSFGPSLMPRTSTMRGVVAGVNVLAARAVTGRVEGSVNRVIPPGAPLNRRLGARAATGDLGVAVGQEARVRRRDALRSGCPLRRQDEPS